MCNTKRLQAHANTLPQGYYVQSVKKMTSTQDTK